MEGPQALLRHRLRVEPADLAAAGGPGAVIAEKRPVLCYAPDSALWFEDAFACRGQSETYYPAAAVLAAVRYPDLRTLHAAWHAALGMGAVFPLLWSWTEGHDTAFIPESVVLSWLIYLMPECAALLRAD